MVRKCKPTKQWYFLYPYQGTCNALHDLLPFVQFKEREKNPRRSVTFSKVATLLKVTLLNGCFSRFLNYANDTKLRNTSHIH